MEISESKLKEILENGWGKRANLSGTDLRNADLHGVNMSDANLYSTKLHGADLSCADLRCANLRCADLSCATLRYADLRYADLLYADLRDADLHRADLSGADLRGADLRGSDLDFSTWPLWCGGLHVKTDRRIMAQLAYHFCCQDCDDPDYIKARDAILWFANSFHRVSECGKLEPLGKDRV